MGEIRIVSRSGQLFKNRQEAGRLLAYELMEFKGQDAIVLGIPRGGVIVARQIAHALKAQLDVVLAHKLRTPSHEEFAIGSIAEDGELFVDRSLISALGGINESYIQQEKEQQLEQIRRRAILMRRLRPKVPLKDRIVIIADDGIATGFTFRAALWTVQLEQPKKLIAAVPVAPIHVLPDFVDEVDQILCLRAPHLFNAVGTFYRIFNPVGEAEVLEILSEEQQKVS